MVVVLHHIRFILPTFSKLPAVELVQMFWGCKANTCWPKQTVRFGPLFPGSVVICFIIIHNDIIITLSIHSQKTHFYSFLTFSFLTHSHLFPVLTILSIYQAGELVANSLAWRVVVLYCSVHCLFVIACCGQISTGSSFPTVFWRTRNIRAWFAFSV